MKKMFSLLTIATMILNLCACGVDEVGSNTAVDEISADVPFAENLAAKKEPVRFMCLSNKINSEQTAFEYSYDMDLDGNPELIKMNISEEITSDGLQLFDVEIGNHHRDFEIENGIISDVYICDVDVTDNMMNLAVNALDSHGFSEFRILSYEPGLPAYSFYTDAGEKDYLSLQGNIFNVNNDNSITLSSCTSVDFGYWTVCRTYALDDFGVFNEKKPVYYEIQHDFSVENYVEWYHSVMDVYFQGEDISEKEKEMLKKGYIKAHKELITDNLIINKGEYFKAPYDNGTDEIYIEKENGDSTWVVYDSESFGYLNQYFFQTWGF